MLTRLRDKVSVILNRLAGTLASLGVKPNHITLLSMVFSLTALYYAYLSEPIMYTAMLALSGLMDMLDGAVARASGKVTRLGGIMDSTIDRISDAAAIVGLYYLVLGFETTILLLITSYMISYVRARAEAEGIRLEGIGLIERAERLIFIMVSASLLASGYAYAARLTIYLLVFLSLVSLAQRIIYIVREAD